MNLTNLLPPSILESSQSAVRFLEVRDRLYRIGLLFQRHDRGGAKTIRRVRYPERLGGKLGAKPGEVGVSYAIAGRAVFRDANGQQHDVQPGNLYFFYRKPDGEMAESLDARPGFQECCLYLDDQLGRRLIELGIWQQGKSFYSSPPSPPLLRTFLGLREELLNHGLADHALLLRTISVMEEVYRHARGEAVGDPEIARACEILDDRIEPSFKAQDAARMIGMHYETFRRRFTRVVGVSPGAYQLRERMNRACRLLRTHTVQETADLLGYTDPFFFSRQFKRQVGVAPKHFRESADRPGSTG